MQLTKTTNQIDIKNIIDLGLFDSKSINHIQLAKHIGSRYFDFTEEECAWMDKFWDTAYNNSWLLVTREMIVENFGYKENKDIYVNFSAKKLNKKFEENTDYMEVDSNHHLVKSCSYNFTSKIEDKWGGSNKKYYIITGETFKACCMMANTETGTKTRKYFLKMESLAKFMSNVLYECMKHQMETKMKEKDVVINQKDGKIDELIIKIDNQSKENTEMKKCIQEQNRQIQELLNYGKQTVSKLEDVSTKLVDAEQDRDIIKTHLEDVSVKLEDTSIKLEDTSAKLEDVSNKLGIVVEDRVPKPEDKGKVTTFVMIENDASNQYQFHVIRRQQNSVNTEIKKYLKENPGSKEFLRIEEQPNAINLLIRIKESMKKDLVFYRNDLSSKTMTKEELKSKILKIHNERKDV